jgi:hypothetical protein
MVPTYFRRCSGIECFNGHCGFALLFFASKFIAGASKIVVMPREGGASSTLQLPG